MVDKLTRRAIATLHVQSTSENTRHKGSTTKYTDVQTLVEESVRKDITNHKHDKHDNRVSACEPCLFLTNRTHELFDHKSRTHLSNIGEQLGQESL